MNLHGAQTTLKEGMQAKLICKNNNREVGEGTITKILPGELEFTETDPRLVAHHVTEFVYRREWGGWKSIHQDPFTGERCTSEFGGVYLFRPMEE